MAAPIGVDERERDGVVDVELHLHLGDLIALGGEKAEEDPARFGVRGHHLLDGDGRSRVPFDLIVDEERVAARRVGRADHDDVIPLVEPLRVPQRSRASNPARLPEGGALVQRLERSRVSGARRTGVSDSKRAKPRIGHGLGSERPPRGGRHRRVAVAGVEGVTEGVEQRDRGSAGHRLAVEVIEEAARDAASARLRRDAHARDRCGRHRATAEEGLGAKEKRVTDDLAVIQREPQVVDRAERVREEVSPPLGLAPRVGERAAVDRDHAIEVLLRGRPKLEVAAHERG